MTTKGDKLVGVIATDEQKVAIYYVINFMLRVLVYQFYVKSACEVLIHYRNSYVVQRWCYSQIMVTATSLANQ